MSRIGRLPVVVPKGVNLEVQSGKVVVKGPKGTLTQAVNPEFKFELENGTLTVFRPTDQKRHRAEHGLYRALIQNMVKGVSEGFQTTLQLVGIGYRAEVNGNIINLAMGYSHPIVFVLPPEVTAEAEYKKGEDPRLILRSNDKQLLGQVVAKVKEIRSPEPYKGKGIRIEGEYVRRKAGKTGKGK
jgi:large subunit ribosomal protein L6